MRAPDQAGPLNEYYNLNGTEISIAGPRYPMTRIILTCNDSSGVLIQFAKDNKVIDCPSQEVIDTMSEAFKRADNTDGLEQQFFVGKKGRLSFILQGKREVVNVRPARVYLDRVKHDVPAYDVHTHGGKLSGNESLYFLPDPSKEDKDSIHFRDRAEANVILSYIRTDLGYERVILFYNIEGTITKMPFDDFKNLVSNISSKKRKQ